MEPKLFLHELNDFGELIQIVSGEHGIVPQLIEKDYWIMHCLFGLTSQGFSLQLKGGTSPSKGYGIIDRFQRILTFRLIRLPEWMSGMAKITRKNLILNPDGSILSGWLVRSKYQALILLKLTLLTEPKHD